MGRWWGSEEGSSRNVAEEQVKGEEAGEVEEYVLGLFILIHSLS